MNKFESQLNELLGPPISEMSYDSATLDHTNMRIGYMSDSALRARIGKIKNPDKMHAFYVALKAAGKHELAKLAMRRAIDMGVDLGYDLDNVGESQETLVDKIYEADLTGAEIRKLQQIKNELSKDEGFDLWDEDKIVDRFETLFSVGDLLWGAKKRDDLVFDLSRKLEQSGWGRDEITRMKNWASSTSGKWNQVW